MMTWAQIRQLYLQVCGDADAVKKEAYVHLSEANRHIGLLIDLPELNTRDQVTVQSGNDFVFVESLSPMFALLDMTNITDGVPMYPEVGGMTGRRRYLTTTGKPLTGPVTHYQRDGNRIWLRGTANVATTVEIRLQKHLDDLGDSDLNDSPIVPPQYHMAVVYAAAEKYFLLHPMVDMVGEIPVSRSEKYKAAKLEAITSQKAATVEEDRPRRETMRLSGYRLSARSRRGGR
jgi:hypothetical protein